MYSSIFTPFGLKTHETEYGTISNNAGDWLFQS
jgi:hypothetical protein